MLCTLAYLGGGAFRDGPFASHTPFLPKIYRHSAWTSGATPSVAGAFTLKQCSGSIQNTPSSFRKLKIFLGTGITLCPDLTHSGRETPPAATSTVAPFGAQPLAPFPKS